VATPVRVRFAPSPTGYLHVGGARTALFNWLFARQTGGRFILRLEDTDEARNTEAARRTIFDGLRWLGLEPDEGPEQGGPCAPYSQSERQPIYARAIAELQARGAIYPCFCTRERLQELRTGQEARREPLRYDRRCRDLGPGQTSRLREGGAAPAWRLRVPAGETVLSDLVRGRIVVRHEDVEDIILVRGDGTPVYNLAVVIDDHEMGITHVLRGEDHLTNCFKQIILFRAFGWPVPAYGHLPLILGPAGEGKLSKRKHPEAALEHYIREGYHPEAVVNWLALIGWSFDDKTEIMSREELIARFSIDRVNPSGARLNIDKLRHLSGDYIRREPVARVIAEITPRLVSAGLVADPPPAAARVRIEALARAEHERLRSFGEIVELARWAFSPSPDFEDGARRNLTKHPGTAGLLRDYAASLPDPLPIPSVLEGEARAFAAARGVGFGQLVHPVRAALTGRTSGPPLFDCLHILGREESCRRLLAAAGLAES
jgi:glutamyl-tRNA synthetase